MLKLVDVRAGYGDKVVLEGVSLAVEEGEVVALIGANGSGKSTTFGAIMRQIPIFSGSIELDGASINHLSPPDVVGRGMVLVPEGRRIFAGLTVRENLKMGAYARNLKGDALSREIDEVLGLFPVLKGREGQLGGTMSGGEQQILALARAVMGKPRLMLLDEPSMGLAPIMVEKVFEKILEISQRGTTILLVEQNARMAFSVAHRGYIMEKGMIILEGTCSYLSENRKVLEAYLGVVCKSE